MRDAIPCEAPAIEHTAPAVPGGPSRVVVFDRDPDSELTGVLEQLNHHADRATLQEVLSGERPTAALVSDRAEAPLDLCAALSPYCPVILATRNRSFPFRLAAAEAGVTALIRRPVDPSELSEWLGHLDAAARAEAISVTIVDDDWLTAELNAAVLRASGMSVTIVNDPTQALRAIEDARPDLVLMDMRMPEVDGIRLAQVIRQSRDLISLPIVFLSAERDEARQLSARRLGGDDFIAKTVPPDRLVSLVRMRAERSRALRSLIERDRLTGLYDHTRFKERLAHEIERCRRTGAEISLVTIDIDRFKRVNDQFGHPVGDTVIRTLSGALTAGLRRIDVIGRLGGEEFGVLMLDTGPANAWVVVDRLRERFGRIAFEGGERFFASSFSAGIASSRDHASVSDLVAASDAALYRAKHLGRDRVEIDAAGSPRGS